MPCRVFYHHAGNRVEASVERAASVEQTLVACLGRVNDRLRLHLDDNDMHTLFATDAAWEIVYDEPQRAAFGPYGEREFVRLVVPLTGRLGTDPEGAVVSLVSQSPGGAWALWTCELSERAALQPLLR